MDKTEVYITKSSEETKKLGKKIVEKLNGRNFLAFYGNLGSGKTTFIQGLSEGLGIKRRIISPTFIIVRHYDLAGEKYGFGYFYHIDLYRTATRNDLLTIGLDEIINDKNNLIALEWAEKMEGLLPKQRIELRFEYLGQEKRKITVSYF